MKAFHRYSWIAITSARSNLSYLSEVVARTIFLFVVLYIFLQLWRVTYQETQVTQLGGFTLAQMFWYLGITEAIVLSSSGVSRKVDEDVRTGALAVQLVRPVSYPFYQLWSNLGERLVRFSLNLCVSAILAFYFVGPIPLSLLGIGWFIVVLLIALILDFWCIFLVGLGAFWLEDTNGLILIYTRLKTLLGGMMIPLELFPDNWQPILQNLPFASILYGPARLFVAPDSQQAFQILRQQVIMLLVVGCLVAWVYQIGIRRIQANGG
jgi:ABC-2 type transport system permease protein